MSSERWQLKYWYRANDVRHVECSSPAHVRHAVEKLPFREGRCRVKAVILLNGFLWELLL